MIVDKRPYELKRRGHVWKKDEDGYVEIFAYAEGHHNGPQCVKCGYGFCHHCREVPAHDCAKAKPKRKVKKAKRRLRG